VDKVPFSKVGMPMHKNNSGQGRLFWFYLFRMENGNAQSRSNTWGVTAFKVDCLHLT